MRVIHILDHSIPLQSGYARRTLEMFKVQRTLGWETFNLTGPKQGPVAAVEEDVEGWHFHRTLLPGGLLEGVPGLEEIELMGEIIYRIEQIAKRVQPHILHAHSPFLNAIPALRVGRRLGIPVVYEVRPFQKGIAERSPATGAMRSYLRRGLEKWALRRADAVITTDDAQQANIVAGGISSAKVTVIPDPLDINQTAPDGASDTAQGGAAVDRSWQTGATLYESVYAKLMQTA